GVLPRFPDHVRVQLPSVVEQFVTGEGTVAAVVVSGDVGGEVVFVERADPHPAHRQDDPSLLSADHTDLVPVDDLAHALPSLGSLVIVAWPWLTDLAVGGLRHMGQVVIAVLTPVVPGWSRHSPHFPPPLQCRLGLGRGTILLLSAALLVFGVVAHCTVLTFALISIRTGLWGALWSPCWNLISGRPTIVLPWRIRSRTNLD